MILSIDVPSSIRLKENRARTGHVAVHQQLHSISSSPAQNEKKIKKNKNKNKTKKTCDFGPGFFWGGGRGLTPPKVLGGVVRVWRP